MAPKIVIDEDRHEVFVGDRKVSLKAKEFKILVALKKSNKTMSRNDFMRELYSDDPRVERISYRVIDVHVCRLRKKMRVPVIETVPTFGYKYIGA